mgnify:CR=1 FL=1
MTFDPAAPSQEERANAYFLPWIGLVANAVLLADYVLDLGSGIGTASLAITGAMIFVTVLARRYDDYFNGLRNTALQWGMAVVALYLFAGAVMGAFNGGNLLGHWSATGDLPDLARGNPGFMGDGYLLAVIAGLAYHLGFAFARLRGTSRA